MLMFQWVLNPHFFEKFAHLQILSIWGGGKQGFEGVFGVHTKDHFKII